MDRLASRRSKSVSVTMCEVLGRKERVNLDTVETHTPED